MSALLQNSFLTKNVQWKQLMEQQRIVTTQNFGLFLSKKWLPSINICVIYLKINFVSLELMTNAVFC